ncbi:MAG: S41 family peptidase [Candidatus Eremiobacteraeota bacterium]|nr:S41 family peptidase [Candidatus Eremiobacteraeota bacterium]
MNLQKRIFFISFLILLIVMFAILFPKNLAWISSIAQKAPLTDSSPVTEVQNREIIVDNTRETPSGEKDTRESSRYGNYINKKKKLGFTPTTELCNRILFQIKYDFVDEVSPRQIFRGVKDEIKELFRESGISENVDRLPETKDIFSKVSSEYSDRIDKRLLLFACINGMIRGLDDRYTAFLTPDQYKGFIKRTHEEKYSGIGVRISKKNKNTPLVILEVFDYSPAKKAGLKRGDTIMKINNAAVKGITLARAARLITGKENTSVKITIKRNKKILKFKVLRKKITVGAIHHRILKGGIGYIKIDSFKEELNDEFRKVYSRMEDKGIKSLIIDLRNNPGGLVLSARELCGCFLPRNSVISVFMHRGKEKRKIRSVGRRIVFIPVAVLINSHSASSAEITAAALKDHDMATIIGETTKGKGSVQRTTPLPDNCALKLTIEKIFSPDGYSINKMGVKPDIEEKMDIKKLGSPEDTQLKKAAEFLRGKVKKK